ncbi:MAG: DNA gyrase/topoisomerase IV subunit A, partial [Bacteroidetes bacterium]|nr:DNA gyrase/topoisomerase IV subunit A [Bacteroidota bacterium]
SERVKVQLHPNSTARIKEFEFDFGTLEIKGRGANGNILTKFPVRKMDLLEKGKSSIGGIKLWFDEKFGRLVSEEKDKSYYLGEFNTGDQIIVAFKDGNVELTNFELTNKYELDEILTVEKFEPEQVYSAVYYDGNNKEYYVKRFHVELKTEKLKSSIVTEHKDSKLAVFSSRNEVWVKFNVLKGKSKDKSEEEVSLSKMIDVKGWKALGNRLTQHSVTGKVAEEIKAEELPKEVKIGTTIELEVSPKAKKKGEQGDLF